jgi:hypothetical protein
VKHIAGDVRKGEVVNARAIFAWKSMQVETWTIDWRG